jgi:hypothetical protein
MNSDVAAAVEGSLMVLCRDLLFASKITSAAQAAGAPVKLLRDAAKLNEQPSQARRLIVDLSQDGFLDAAAAWKQKTGGHVTGFAGHADTQTLDRARDAGLDAVLSRGEFAATLADVVHRSTAVAPSQAE